MDAIEEMITNLTVAMVVGVSGAPTSARSWTPVRQRGSVVLGLSLVLKLSKPVHLRGHPPSPEGPGPTVGLWPTRFGSPKANKARAEGTRKRVSDGPRSPDRKGRFVVKRGSRMGKQMDAC